MSTQQPANEVWECFSLTDTNVTFLVQNGNEKEDRIEDMTHVEFTTFLTEGGYPPFMTEAVLLGKNIGWKFRKQGKHIYLDGPSTSDNPDDSYHPIDK